MYPALTYRDVRAALAWAEAAFGLVPRIFGAGSEDVVHAGLVHGDGMVLVERERPDELHGSHTGRAWVYVAVDDVDAHLRRAKAAGADVLNEPQLASIATLWFGRRGGWCEPRLQRPRPQGQCLDLRNGQPVSR